MCGFVEYARVIPQVSSVGAIHESPVGDRHPACHPERGRISPQSGEMYRVEVLHNAAERSGAKPRVQRTEARSGISERFMTRFSAKSNI